MTFLLIAAVVLIGALAVLDLLLTLAVLRRLRAQAVRQDAGDPDLSLRDLVGRPLPDTPAAGTPALVALLSGSCPSCSVQAPAFSRYAEREPGGPDAVLAVVSGDGEPARRLAALVAGSATVVTEPEQGPMTSALGVEVFPTFLRVDGAGRIVAATSSLEELPAAQPAS